MRGKVEACADVLSRDGLEVRSEDAARFATNMGRRVPSGKGPTLETEAVQHKSLLALSLWKPAAQDSEV